MTTPIQLTIGITPPHRNQYLFSDHYLDELLRQDPRWSQALPQAETLLCWLQQLYAQEQAQLPQYNESQLEEHWIKPILTQLGHVFEPQASVPGLKSDVTFPDYVFFPDESARHLAAGVQKTDEYAHHALAVGEAKRWNLDLGKKQKGGGASFEARNPMWQIDYYIRTTELEWGILTNGCLCWNQGAGTRRGHRPCRRNVATREPGTTDTLISLKPLNYGATTFLAKTGLQPASKFEHTQPDQHGGI